MRTAIRRPPTFPTLSLSLSRERDRVRADSTLFTCHKGTSRRRPERLCKSRGVFRQARRAFGFIHSPWPKCQFAIPCPSRAFLLAIIQSFVILEYSYIRVRYTHVDHSHASPLSRQNNANGLTGDAVPRFRISGPISN